MQLAVLVLGTLGVAAVSVLLLRAGLRLLRRGLERHAATEVARTRARRGDVTGMAEAQRHAERAGSGTRHAAAQVAGWLLALVAPAFVPGTRTLYATYGAAALAWIVLRASGVARSGGPELGDE